VQQEKMIWRFLNSGSCSPAENMAIDEAILTMHSKGLVPPTVRFYGWNPATLSIGYFQKADEEVDLDKLSARGLGFVRRPTGGRAVLHDAELTYSLIVSEDYPGIPRSVNDAYRVLSEGLVHGFRRLGLQAEMVNLSAEEDKSKYMSAGSAACFDSPSWYELVVEGRKIAGSAQVRQKGVVLQHGSILLDMDVDLLFEVLRFPSERVKERLHASFSNKAVAINDLTRALGREAVTREQAEQAFQAGIAEGLGIELEPSDLSVWEKELALQLVQDKYGNEQWNLRR
jgi:lipoyl(octanoyl) transferase